MTSCQVLNENTIASRIGLFVASFLRQAISMRDECLSEVPLRDRFGVPPHRTRNLLVDPPSDAELLQDFDECFTAGELFFSLARVLCNLDYAAYFPFRRPIVRAF